jgi:hypothetical protein
MSFLFPHPAAPTPPPPPPNPANIASPSIIEQGAAERSQLAGAQGAGSDGTDVTGGKNGIPGNTTANPAKTLLGA